MFIKSTKKCSFFLKAVAFFLVVTLLSPVAVSAVEPRASDYLDSYTAYPYAAGLGKIQIWFTVTADNYMDDIGALRISIYESTDNSTWTLKETHTNESTPSLLGHDAYYYSGHVEYQGVIGRYYKAYVCIWAGKDGGGDTRYFWTSSQKATFFTE